MCRFICLMLVLMFIRPSSLQTGIAESGVTVAVPVLRLGVAMWYNTTNGETVTKSCGEHYATTFLRNFINTESLLQASCQEHSVTRLVVRHAVVARVRLHDSLIELNTHSNISLADPGQHLHGNGATPRMPSSVGGQSWAGKDDILRCATSINQKLLQPAILQMNFNSQLGPENIQTRSIDILHIQGNQCPSAMMDPQEMKISDQEWICPNEQDYIYDERTWKCIPKAEATTSQLHDPITTTPATTTLQTNPVGTSPVTSSTISPTDRPIIYPWIIRLVNNTRNIRMAEGDSPVPVTFHLSVNHTGLCIGLEPCLLTVKISFSDSQKSEPKCRTTGDIVPQIVLAEPAWGSSMDDCNLPLNVSAIQEFTRTINLAPMLDMKYDGRQKRRMWFSVSSIVGNDTGPSEENALSLPIFIEDRDRKATCKSVNDPHITTFDGFEYNNFFEGEFVLYEHTTLPYKVHVIYQKCSPSVKASCNCAVAVQSGDDVIVIDRCRRDKEPFNRLSGQSTYKSFTKMSVDLYLNGDLTPGTSVYEEADGKKYVIYLPHGAYIKVMVSGDLINVWVVASPKDAYSTVGLCGTNDQQKDNDLQMRDGSIIQDSKNLQGERPQPKDFCLEWRVELLGANSIFRGVPEKPDLKKPIMYCVCMPTHHFCGYAVDISVCDVLQGKDVTDWLISRASAPVLHENRVKRSVDNNAIGVFPDEPIVVDTNFIPPEYSWDDQEQWQYSSAQDFCNDYVRDKYEIGKMCSAIPAVDFNQEITTCIEDIQITGNTSWADSARDAMKEQCLEEVQRNGSLPFDIASAICINDCNNRGKCLNGSCKCNAGWFSADCSLTMEQPPYSSEMPANGLCDTRYMKCNRVIVYGDNFVDNQNLTCHLQQTYVADEPSHFKALPHITKTKGLFINFNAVECPLPTVKPYLIRVSNDGILDHASDPLLFLPFDSACFWCSTNSTTCTKRRNSCRIDGKCYLENERSPNDLCLICKPFADELQWTTDSGASCRPSWWESVRVPNWFIAVAAAIGGSIVGVLIGFLLYKCCCKQKQKEEQSDNVHDSGLDESDASHCEDIILHRDRGMPSFMDDRFLDIAFRSPEVEESYFHNNNTRRIQNGIDSTTYF